MPPATGRQLDVLRRIAQGKPNKEIGQEPGITEATVKSHTTDIMRALKVTNRVQTGLAARRMDIDMTHVAHR